MRSPILAVVSVLVVLVGVLGLAWLKRPRLVVALLLFPFSIFGGVWRQAKRLWNLPENISKWLAYSVLEKDANSLKHHAETASAFWSAGPEFRPAARELLNRVLAGYGIRPAESEDMDPAPGNGDAFAQARVNAAAKAVTESGKKAHAP